MFRETVSVCGVQSWYAEARTLVLSHGSYLDQLLVTTGRNSLSDSDPGVGTISLKIGQIQRVAPDHPANAPLSPPRSVRAKRRGSSEACVG